MTVQDNKLYVNHSLEIVLIKSSKSKYSTEFTSEAINSNRAYYINKKGEALTAKHHLFDINFEYMFKNKDYVHISSNFDIFYNNSIDWFQKSDLFYGVKISNIDEFDTRFLIADNKNYASVAKFRKGSSIYYSLERKYINLRSIVIRDGWHKSIKGLQF